MTLPLGVGPCGFLVDWFARLFLLSISTTALS